MKKIILLFVILVAGVLILLIILKWNSTNFLDISIGDILSIFNTIIIAYFLTQLSADERKRKEKIEDVMSKIEKFIDSDEALFHGGKINKPMVLMNLRSTNNKIHLLEKLAKSMNIFNEVKSIRNYFNEYREIIGENIENYDYLSQSDNRLLRSLKLIHDKCDEIRIKLY